MVRVATASSRSVPSIGHRRRRRRRRRRRSPWCPCRGSTPRRPPRRDVVAAPGGRRGRWGRGRTRASSRRCRRPAATCPAHRCQHADASATRSVACAGSWAVQRIHEAALGSTAPGSVAAAEPLLEVRCLVADRGRVAVAGVHDRLGRQRQQLLADRPDDRVEVAEAAPRRTGTAAEQRVAREQVGAVGGVGVVEAAAAGGVARGVDAPRASCRRPTACRRWPARGRARGRGTRRPTASGPPGATGSARRPGPAARPRR